jgi:hypothetical protein
VPRLVKGQGRGQPGNPGSDNDAMQHGHYLLYIFRSVKRNILPASPAVNPFG